ncbi:MAG: Na/Pi cotransporter family protein [Cryomorphaceae bacterium]
MQSSFSTPFFCRTICLSALFAIAFSANAQAPLEHFGAVTEDAFTEVYWSVDCDADSRPDSVRVRYNRAATLAGEGEFWFFSDPVPYGAGRIVLQDLAGASNYIYQVGHMRIDSDASPPRYTWSPRKGFETKLPWGPTRFLLMIGALCMFIYGMKVMSEGVQASAGNKLRKALAGMTRNRLTGVASGFGLTALLQSSSATTVMTVSFVNAGLITLSESAGMMMGANIGTTITGWFVSLIGLRVNITLYALILFAIAVPLIFVRKREIKTWSTPLIGFALLFMGLGFLRTTVPSFTQDSEIVQFFIEYSGIPVAGVLLFVLLGAFITVIVQSSSSAITLTMTLCASGVIPLEAAAAMVLGENIGTTATAEIAALVGNVHAKRSARIHSLFNVIGVAWMVFLLPFVLNLIGSFMPESPFTDTAAGRQSATASLAVFHSFFNVANLFILIWFVPLLIKLATFTVPSRGKDDEIHRLEYIDTSIQLSELNIVEARKAVTKFGEIVQKMSLLTRRMITETETSEKLRIHQKISRYEEITDNLEIEISRYCSRISTTELSNESSERVRAMLSISNDLERIGDIYNRMSIAVIRKTEDKIWFTQEQRDKLIELMNLVENALRIMLTNLKRSEGDKIDLESAVDAERAINRARNAIRKEYISRIEKGKYNLRSGTIYSELFSSLEKVGDHIINVSEALAGEEMT